MNHRRISWIIGLVIGLFCLAFFSRSKAAQTDSIYPGDSVLVVYEDGGAIIGGENTFSTHRFADEEGTPVYCGYYKGGSADGVETVSRGILTQNVGIYQEYTRYSGYDIYWLEVMDYILMRGYHDSAQGSLSFEYDGTAVSSLTGKTVKITDEKEMWLVTQYALWWCEVLGRDGVAPGWSNETYYYSGCFNTFGNPGECFPSDWGKIYAAHYALLKEAMTYVDTYGASGVSGEVILLEPVNHAASDGVHSLVQLFVMYGGDQTPPEGTLKLQKASSYPAITAGNSCYQLTGSTYGVYRDKKLTDKVGTLVVQNESGESNTLSLAPGTYYVKEEIAGYGYKLDTKTHTVEVTSNQNTLLEVEETPGNDPAVVTIEKRAAKTGDGFEYDLSGTQFKLEFYAAYYDTVKQARKHTPDKVFVIQVKKLGSGVFAASLNESYLVQEESDEPYMNASGTRIILPLGTLIISEYKAAPGFVNDCIFTDSNGNTEEGAYLAKILPNGNSFGLASSNSLFVEESGFSATDQPNEKEVVIQKEDKETGENAQGEAKLTATFSIYALADIKGTTIKKGDLVKEGLKQGESLYLMPGKYQVKETSCHEGYVLNEKTVTINVKDQDGVQTFTFVNQVKKQAVKVSKTMEGRAQTQVPEQGAEFDIIFQKTGEVVAHLVTDENGIALSDPLPYGSYLLKQTKGTEGYFFCEDITFSVEEDSSDPLCFTLTNQLKTGALRVIKTGPVLTGYTEEETEYGTLYVPVFEEKAIAGVKFGVYAAEEISHNGVVLLEKGEKAGEIVTSGNEEGDVLENLPLGTYIVVEEECPADYVLPKEALPSQEVTLREEEEGELIEATVCFSNEFRKTRVLLKKEARIPELTKDETTGEASVTLVNKPGEGFIFGLYEKESERLFGLATSNSAGQIVFDLTLPEGTYVIKELECPAGFIKTEETKEIEVGAGEPNENLEFDLSSEPIINEWEEMPGYGVIRIKKTGLVFSLVEEEETEYGIMKTAVYQEQLLAGAVFEIRAAEDIIVLDKVAYARGELVDTLTTGTNGSAVSKLLFPGKYEVTEIKAPEGFLISRKPVIIPVTASSDEEITPEIITVADEIRDVKILLVKEMEEEEGTSPGEGIVFGLYADEAFTAYDGTVIAKDDLMMLAVSQKDGSVVFSGNLPVGKYYILELKTKEGYVLLEGKINIDLSGSAELKTDSETAGEKTIVIDLTETPVVNYKEPEEPEPEEPEPEEPEPEEPEPEEPGPHKPRTGDMQNPLKYALAGGVSLVGFVLLGTMLLHKKRRQ